MHTWLIPTGMAGVVAVVVVVMVGDEASGFSFSLCNPSYSTSLMRISTSTFKLARVLNRSGRATSI